MKNRKVSIIIPVTYLPIFPYEFFLTHNLKKLEVFKNEFEVILIDNSNYSKNIRQLFKDFYKKGYKIVEFPFKFRYPLVYNYASKYASGDYILFLDNFVYIENGNFIYKFIDILDREQEVAAVFAKLVNLDVFEFFISNSVGIINFIYKIFKPLKLFYYKIKYKEKSSTKNFLLFYLLFKILINLRYILDILGIKNIYKSKKFLKNLDLNHPYNFGCFMVKREAFNRVGGFDEEYQNYYYNYDFILKLKKIGYKVKLCEYIKIKYLESLSLGMFKYNNFPKVYDEKIFLKKNIHTICNEQKNKKILIIKLFTMGDAIMCTPVIKAIKEKYKEYEVNVVSSYPWGEIFENNPYIDNLIILKSPNRSKLLGYKVYDIVTTKFVEIQNWEKVFQLNCLDHYPEYRRTGLHLSDFYASMAGVYPLEDKKYYVFLLDEHKLKIRKLLDSLEIKSKRFFSIHTNGGWNLKNWDDKKWVELSNLLYEKYKMYTVLIGGKNEGRHIESKYIYNLAGKLSIKETAALISESLLFVGLDSGPMHLACALEVPVVALYGNTHPKVSEPRTKNYICIHSKESCEVPCGLKFCKKNINCTSFISVEAVLKAVEKLLLEKNVKEIWLEDKPAKVFFKDWEWHIVEAN